MEQTNSTLSMIPIILTEFALDWAHPYIREKKFNDVAFNECFIVLVDHFKLRIKLMNTQKAHLIACILKAFTLRNQQKSNKSNANGWATCSMRKS